MRQEIRKRRSKRPITDGTERSRRDERERNDFWTCCCSMQVFLLLQTESRGDVLLALHIYAVGRRSGREGVEAIVSEQHTNHGSYKFTLSTCVFYRFLGHRPIVSQFGLLNQPP